MKTTNKRIVVVILAIFMALVAASCTNSETQKEGGQNAVDEQTQVAKGFNRLVDSQQIPSFQYSQERQTLIDVETVRATGAVSTTAGYLEGVGLVWWCPSKGAPIPTTYQLTAQNQWVDLPGDKEKKLYQVEQGEPTGVYTNQSTGTRTICLDDNGKPFAKYWEGYTDSTVGVVNSYPADKRVTLDQSTFTFTTKDKNGN